MAHKAAAVLQKTMHNNRIEMHMDEGTDSWLIIPKSDYIDGLAADADKIWQPGDGNHLPAWARKTQTQIKNGIYIYI